MMKSKTTVNYKFHFSKKELERSIYIVQLFIGLYLCYLDLLLGSKANQVNLL